jgi:alpha-beta hydrolase superfamily lysophospholipase
MKKDIFTINSSVDGLPLSVISIEPDSQPVKGVVQIVHGMAEMKERYIDFMNFLAENGYASIIHDHRGHGQSVHSKDDLGHMYGAGGNGLVEDTYCITQEAKKRWPHVKLTLMGHSMGSLVVRCYAKKYDDQIDALIVMGCPARNGAVGFAQLLVSILKKFKGSRHKSHFINNAAFASYSKGIENPRTDFDWLSVNTDNVDFYLDNEYCGFIFTLDGFKGLFDVQKNCYDSHNWQMKNPSLPIIFLSGEMDPCIGSRAKFDEAINFMKERGYSNIQEHFYKNMRHEILNEDDHMLVCNDILQWLEAH